MEPILGVFEVLVFEVLVFGVLVFEFLVGAYYRFATSRLRPHFYVRPTDLAMVFLRIAASAEDASCVFSCEWATVCGIWDADAASSRKNGLRSGH